LLENSPNHITVCICMGTLEVNNTAKMLLYAMKCQGDSRYDGALKDKTVTRLNANDCSLFVVSHDKHVGAVQGLDINSYCGDTSRMSSTEEVQHWFNYATFCFTPKFPDTAVAVAVFTAPQGIRKIPINALKAMARSIVGDSIQFLVGEFGNTQYDIIDLCRSCGAIGDSPYYQPFTSVNPSGQSTVVEVYPAYIIPFGHAREVKEVDTRNAPTWLMFAGLASTSAVSIQELYSQNASSSAVAVRRKKKNRADQSQSFEVGLITLAQVPYWDKQLQSRAGAVDADDYGTLFSLGVVKSKVLTQETMTKHWIPGVHQVVVWAGVATQGAKAKIKSLSKAKGKTKKGKAGSKGK
jgi:hypothetical protein